MRPGIRLQLVLALAGLMLLAFVPMYVAVASLLKSSVASYGETRAQTVAQLVAAHLVQHISAEFDAGHTSISTAPGQFPSYESTPLAVLQSAVEQERQASDAIALAVYSFDGRRLAFATHAQHAPSPSSPRASVPHYEPPAQLTESIPSMRQWGDPALVQATHRNDWGAVLVAVKGASSSRRSDPALSLTGLYMMLFAVFLLVFTYVGLTRLIVQPIDRLVLAARHMSFGQGTAHVQATGAREIVELALALENMTRQLRSEQQALHEKVLELERTTQKLTHTQRHLVRSERLASVGRLAAGLAHEIGNPMAAIMGMQQLILDGDVDADGTVDFVRRMKRETERIHHVLRQLLDYARPAKVAKPLACAASIGSVDEAIRNACALLEPPCKRRSIELHVPSDMSTLTVPMDTSELTQVLVNLLMNAVDAVGSDGNVWVRACVHGNVVRLTVTDDGRGVDAAVRDSLFEPFVTTKEVGKGTGLGLSVCRGLIENAGGTIDLADDQVLDGLTEMSADDATRESCLEPAPHSVSNTSGTSKPSQPLRGATFVIELPIAEAPSTC